MTHTRIAATGEHEALPQAGATDRDKAFRAAVVRVLLQPLTVASGRVQLAQRLIESDPERVARELDEAREQLDRIDQILAELQVRPPGQR